jgi:hypothetical protein
MKPEQSKKLAEQLPRRAIPNAMPMPADVAVAIDRGLKLLEAGTASGKTFGHRVGGAGRAKAKETRLLYASETRPSTSLKSGYASQTGLKEIPSAIHGARTLFRLPGSTWADRMGRYKFSGAPAVPQGLCLRRQG